MAIEGGCYCGGLRYQAEGDAMFKGQCHCRECQYITGGSPNVILAMPAAGFSYSSGEPKEFTRKDIENPVTRQFCPECGTHIGTALPAMQAMMVKVGTLDDPSIFGQAEMAIFVCDKQSFHTLPEGVPAFDKGPGSASAS